MEKRTINNFKVSSNAVRISSRRRKMKLKRRIVKGSLVAITVGLVAFGVHSCSNIMNESSQSSEIVISTVEDNEDIYEIDIRTDEILSVALVNDGYDDSKFEEAVESLQGTGLNCVGVDINDSTLVDCDSYFFVGVTPYNGSDPKVIANYNGGNSGSDQLAVAMAVASGQDATNIQKGVNDLELARGTFKPSNLEEKIGYKPNITVAYPVGEDINTNEILEAVARVTDYCKQNDNSINDEMLYRVRSGDSPYSLGTNMCYINGIGSNDLLDDNRILLMKSLSGPFANNTVVNVEEVNIKSSTLN